MQRVRPEAAPCVRMCVCVCARARAYLHRCLTMRSGTESNHGDTAIPASLAASKNSHLSSIYGAYVRVRVCIAEGGGGFRWGVRVRERRKDFMYSPACGCISYWRVGKALKIRHPLVLGEGLSLTFWLDSLPPPPSLCRGGSPLGTGNSIHGQRCSVLCHCSLLTS